MLKIHNLYKKYTINHQLCIIPDIKMQIQASCTINLLLSLAKRDICLYNTIYSYQINLYRKGAMTHGHSAF